MLLANISCFLNTQHISGGTDLFFPSLLSNYERCHLHQARMDNNKNSNYHHHNHKDI